MYLQVHLHRQNQPNLLRSSVRTMLRRQKIHATPFSRGMHQILMVRSLSQKRLQSLRIRQTFRGAHSHGKMPTCNKEN